MKAHRQARVSEVIREVASETILFELQDPRIKGVTVTRAEVSGDLQHAKVYVSLMGTEKEQQLCMHGLRHSAGYIQARLAARLKTRFTPVLHFVLDEGVKKSIEVSRLINEARAHSPMVTEPMLAEQEGDVEAESADGTVDEEPQEG
jgi:ribosome-binding factor A